MGHQNWGRLASRQALARLMQVEYTVVTVEERRVKGAQRTKAEPGAVEVVQGVMAEPETAEVG